MLGIATSDIGTKSNGSVKFAEKSGSTFVAGSGVETFEVYNPNLKIWSGSLVVLQWLGITRDPADTDDPRWFVTWTNAARRIRGKAAAAIGAGATGTINSVSPLDGVFGNNNASVYLPTEIVAIASGSVVWAELCQTATGERWEVYSADCV